MVQNKTTIGEVARQAGVSKTTISRYLNQRYEFMSAETKKRIESVIREMGYRPNNLARSLKSNRSGLIGVLVADISNPFSSILVKGIGDTCKNRGFQTIIANTDNDPQKELDYIRSLMDNRVEGLIVNITGENNDYLMELHAHGVPVVLADRPMTEPFLDTVTSNNYEMTYETMRHLVDQGFERVAFFTQETSSIRTRLKRHEAFLQACGDFLHVDGEKFVYVVDPDNVEEVTKAVMSFLKDSSSPSALFAVNGVTLLSIVQSITQLNLRMPDDVGICGYDDWGWAAVIPPGITVISQPSYKVGVEAAKRLLRQIQSKRPVKPKLIELPSSLVVRGSTQLQAKKHRAELSASLEYMG